MGSEEKKSQEEDAGDEGGLAFVKTRWTLCGHRLRLVRVLREKVEGVKKICRSEDVVVVVVVFVVVVVVLRRGGGGGGRAAEGVRKG